MRGGLLQGSPTASWASRFMAEPDQLRQVQDELPVRLIATPQAQLQCCRVREPLRDVVTRNMAAFDFFPVIDGASGPVGAIVGLVELAKLTPEDALVGPIEDYMQPLSETNLIGADAGILAFVAEADRHPCKLVISGNQIAGLVSLSDLQKLPVRAALFALVTCLEMAMAEAIRRDCALPDLWKSRLNRRRQEKLQLEINRSRAGDAWVDDLLFTQFADKMQIIRESPAFGQSKTDFTAELEQAQRLRNGLAHANEYASSRERAAEVCVTVRNIQKRLEWLTAWPESPDSNRG